MMRVSSRLSQVVVATAFLCAMAPMTGQESKSKDQKDQKKGQNLAPFVPTPQEVVDEMLRLAQVRKEDVVYDLGCGDGRIVVTAAKRFGAKGVGVEYDAEVAKLAIANVKQEKLQERVTILHEDALKADVSPATVVTVYLMPEANLKLRPILQKKLKPGARIVAHNFDFGDWKPNKTVKVKDRDGEIHVLYLWTIPAQMPPEK